jgi:hypothetical protein
MCVKRSHNGLSCDADVCCFIPTTPGAQVAWEQLVCTMGKLARGVQKNALHELCNRRASRSLSNAYCTGRGGVACAARFPEAGWKLGVASGAPELCPWLCVNDNCYVLHKLACIDRRNALSSCTCVIYTQPLLLVANSHACINAPSVCTAHGVLNLRAHRFCCWA